MKKIAVILLMGMLLFNWFGYQLVGHYLKQHADRQLETRLDKNDYDNADLIEIRIPLHLPYISNSGEFQRYDGEIDIDGKHYTYVKRRVHNDSLVLLCIANRTKQQLNEAGSRYFTLVNGLQSSSGQQTEDANTFFKTLLVEYQPEQNDWNVHPLLIEEPALATTLLIQYPTRCTTSPEQPPESIS